MGCNQSKSETQPLPINTIHHHGNNRITNSKINHHELPKQTTISHQAILFQENLAENTIESQHQKIQQNSSSEFQKQKVVATIQKQETISIQLNQGIEITNISTLIQAIKQQIQVNQFYNNIFDTIHLKQILSFIRKHNLSTDYLYLILSLLLNFMRSCKQVAREQAQLKIDSFQAVLVSFGNEWSKLKQVISKHQKQNQSILSYIISKKAKQEPPHLHHYLDLTVEKGFKESEKILQALRQMSKYQPNSFCFYTNYLVKCCEKLQLQGKKAFQIEIIIEEHCQSICTQIQNECIHMLKSENSKDQVSNYHQNFKAKLQPQQKRFYEFDIQSNLSKEQQLQQYIKTILDQAQSIYEKLLEFTLDFCRNQEYLFKVQMMDNDEQSVFELKLSTFKDVQFQKYSPLQVESESYSQFVQNELEGLKKQRSSIYEFMTGKIEFKSSCMLQIRHVFENISLLNRCGDSIKQQIQNKEYILLEVKNNLNSSKAEKYLLIMFAINSYKIQIKLVLNFNLSKLIVKGYLQSIIHSKMATTLTSLHMLNNTLTHRFMNRIYPIVLQQIIVNSKQGRLRYQITQEFKELLKIWKIQLPIDSNDSKNQLDCHKFNQKLKNTFLALKANRFTLNDEHKLLKLYNKIIFKSVLRQHQNCDLQFELFRAYINKQKSQPRDNQTNETLKSLVFSYSKCLVTQIQNQISRKNYAKAEQLAKQNEQLQLIFTQQPSLEGMKIRKILALCEYYKSNYNQALRLFNQCIQIIKKIGDKQLKIHTLQIQKQMAIIYKQQGNSFKALSVFNDILTQIYSQEMKEEQFQSTVLRNVADLLIKNSEYEESLVYLSKCLRVIQKSEGKDSMQSIPTIVAIGQVMFMQGKYDEALLQYRKCEQIIKMRKGQRQFMICDILQRIAKVYIQLLHYEQAQVMLTRCSDLIQNEKGINSNEYGEISFSVGKLYLRLQKYQLGLKFLLKALSIRQKTHGKQTIKTIDVLQQIINIYKAMNKYKDEEHYMNKVKNIINKENQKVSISYLNTYNSIAEKSQNRGNYVVALDYYEKSINILEKSNKKGSIQAVGIHQSIANIYREQEHFSAALQYYQKSLEILQTVKGKDNVQGAEVICEIGRLNELQGRTDNALEYYLKCYNLCLRYKVKYRVYAICCYRLGKLFLERGQEQETSKYWKESLPIFQKMLAKQADEIRTKLKEFQSEQFVIQK